MTTDSTISRRKALTYGAGTAAGAALLAALTPAAQSALAGPAHQDAGTHGVAGATLVAMGFGLGTSTYSPGLTATPSTSTLHATATFVNLPTIPIPLLLLLADECNGNFVASCLGQVGTFNLNGLLTWSDGTKSTYDVFDLLDEKIEGMDVTKRVGTITSNHFAGATVTVVAIRVPPPNQITNCLTGTPITNATGATAITITMS